MTGYASALLSLIIATNGVYRYLYWTVYRQKRFNEIPVSVDISVGGIVLWKADIENSKGIGDMAVEEINDNIEISPVNSRRLLKLLAIKGLEHFKHMKSTELLDEISSLDLDRNSGKKVLSKQILRRIYDILLQANDNDKDELLKLCGIKSIDEIRATMEQTESGDNNISMEISASSIKPNIGRYLGLKTISEVEKLPQHKSGYNFDIALKLED